MDSLNAAIAAKLAKKKGDEPLVEPADDDDSVVVPELSTSLKMCASDVAEAVKSGDSESLGEALCRFFDEYKRPADSDD